MIARIDIRAADDWIAVYKDGKKAWENHSCPIEEGLRVLGIEHTYAYDDRDPYENDIGDFFPEELPPPAVFDVPEGIAVERIR